MSTKKKIFVFIGGLIVILALFYMTLFADFSSSNTVTTSGDLKNILDDLSNQPVKSDSNLVKVGESVAVNPVTGILDRQENLSKLSNLELTERQLEIQIRRFVEKWGSYSNQSDFFTIKSLSNKMSTSMQRHLFSYISGIQNEHPYGNGYYGISTTVVDVDIVDYASSASTLTATVAVRRMEAVADQSNVFNQYAEVDLIKIGNEWLIDKVEWLQD